MSLYFRQRVYKVRCFAQQFSALLVCSLQKQVTPEDTLGQWFSKRGLPASSISITWELVQKWNLQSVLWQALQGGSMHTQFKNQCPENSAVCNTWLNKVFSKTILGSSSESVPYHVAFLTLSAWACNLLLHVSTCISQSLKSAHHSLTVPWHICELTVFYISLVQCPTHG